MLPLEGCRILAVEQYGAGPWGTQYLADMGAEVIKIENPKDGGDNAPLDAIVLGSSVPRGHVIHEDPVHKATHAYKAAWRARLQRRRRALEPHQAQLGAQRSIGPGCDPQSPHGPQALGAPRSGARAALPVG